MAKPTLRADRRAPARRTPAKPKAAPRRRARRRVARPARRGPLAWLLALPGRLLRLVVKATVSLALLVALAVGGWAFVIAQGLPPADDLVDGRVRGSVTMLDAAGAPYAWRGDQFGGAVASTAVSPHLRHAVIATEDRRFLRHIGVSPRGIASAVRINLREGRGPLSGHGGSTITQQTAKLLCLGRPYDPDVWDSERDYEADCRRTTLWRKVHEAVFAIGMEIAYTKDEILTVYLNRSYLGGGARGFEAASQLYFGRSAREVDPAQAAMLAGLLKAPSTFAPTRSLDRAQGRAGVVIGLMEAQGYLTAAQADAARADPADLTPAARRRAGGYFADWVMEQGPDFFTRDTTEDVTIATTLDPRWQAAAEAAVADVFANQVRAGSEAQAAVVVMSADGAVRAMVGGRGQGGGVFNRATQALRQSGSAFKPFVYAAALEAGLSPLSAVMDTELSIELPGQAPYRPQNYDRRFRGEVTLTEALAASLNIPAVRLSERVGRSRVREIAEGFGVVSDLAQGPALALGASETTLIEMTGAFAGILNGGSAVRPYGITSLSLAGQSEPLMGRSGGIASRVIPEDAARQLIWMMHRVVVSGTGQGAAVPGREIAGKTGTSQSARDAWFVGFDADTVIGVWMGYDDNTPLSGVTGGGLPATIFARTMAAGAGPARALPMITPVAPRVAVERESETADRVADGILSDTIGDVLRQIRGGN
ncbi:MAG: transglycosylase domain-containing protein [Paracoccaceae bacterium]